MRVIVGIFVVLVVVVLTGCSAGRSGGATHSPVSQARTRDARTRAPGPSSVLRPADHRGSLTADERSLATALARREQRTVIGTFIVATAFVARGTPFDRGSACDVGRRFVTIRLVWKADANFTHSYPPDAPPDGPRKAVLIMVDPRTRALCEMLLYGEWPGRAAGRADRR